MNNEEFFQQFKSMFDDPFQRRELVEYFDKLVQECTANPKPMRVAVVGYGADFQGFVRNVVSNFGGKLKCVHSATRLKVSNFEFMWCVNEHAAQGAHFEAYMLISEGNKSHNDLCFYMVARNIPVFSVDILHKELSLRVSNLEHA